MQELVYVSLGVTADGTADQPWRQQGLLGGPGAKTGRLCGKQSSGPDWLDGKDEGSAEVLRVQACECEVRWSLRGSWRPGRRGDLLGEGNKKKKAFWFGFKVLMGSQ